MKIVVLGANGQLGLSLVPLLISNDFQVSAFTSKELDIRDLEKMDLILRILSPEVIINCAAYTNVEAAESSHILADEVNVYGSRNVAITAKKLGSVLIHFSTDYVFSGFSDVPWQESDKPYPVNYYGKSKLLGELEVIKLYSAKSYVIRTSWLFSEFGTNFVKKISKLLLNQDIEPIRIVDDQTGGPTSCLDLSRRVSEILLGEASFGIYHVTNSGQATWYELALAISKTIGGKSSRIVPIRSENLKSVVKRPSFSVLDNTKMELAGFSRMPHWEVSLVNEMPRIVGSNMSKD